MGDHRPDLVTGNTRDHAFRAVSSLVLSGLVLLGPCSWQSPAARSSVGKKKHAERVFSITWSPKGDRLASAGFDGTIRIWDTSATVQIRLLRASSPTVLFTSWSPRGDRLLSITNEEMQVFDPDSGSEISSVRTRIGAKAAPAWGPDGRFLALPTFDGEVRLLDSNGKDLAVLVGHDDEISSVEWTPDGRLLATGSWDGTILVRNVETGKQIHIFERSPSAIRLAWSPDGKTLGAFSSAQADVSLWDVRTGAGRSLTSAGEVTAVAWKPDGTLLAIGLADGTIELRDPVLGATRAATRCGNFIDELAWSACGRWLASVGFMESTVCVWDSKTRSKTTVGGHRRPVIAIAWSPVNTLLASGGYDGKVRLWKSDMTDPAPTESKSRSKQ